MTKYGNEIRMIRRHKAKFGDRQLCDRLIKEDRANNWPVLIGTDKQIILASKIRRQLINNRDASVDELMNEHSSEWWINNRRRTECIYQS